MLLGTPTAEASELYALTVTEGDPAWAGPLAGVALNLPVYHILEPEVREQVPPGVYEEEVGLAVYSLDAEEIGKAVQKVRENGG